jgi:hypothetical protein
MTTLYLAGGEVPSHRKLMRELNVPALSLSYFGLRRRVKFAKPWLLHDKFNDGQRILLDSGAHTVNQGSTQYTDDELVSIYEHYVSFVDDNIDRLELVSEFDALPLGHDWIAGQRGALAEVVGNDKFLPIWHPEYGLDNLTELADNFLNVGVTTTSFDGRDITQILNRLGEDNRLHGVGITSTDDMYAIRWSSLSSTSWISPQQYGDTIIWTGRELKRYPKKYKEQSRKRFRTMFDREGFDYEKIEADDSTELLRLSIWSWQQLMDDIDKKRPNHLRVVTNPVDGESEPIVEVGGEVVDTHTGEVRNGVTTPSLPVIRREPVPLPVLGITSRTEKVTDESGDTKEVEVQTFGLRSESERKCVSCYLASKCPAFEPGSNCAFNIPVQVKSREQFEQIQNSLIEMQTQRVMFLRFAEETEGGYADPNLSAEMDRLQKFLKTKHDMDEDGFSLKLDVKAKGNGGGGAGMLARLFGDQASQTARQLDNPVDADTVIEQIVEGEWAES